MNILVWTLDGRNFGIDIRHIERTLSAVEIVPLPNAPAFVLGAVNLHGTAIPLFDMRSMLGIHSKELEASDHFILCKAQNKRLALLVDSVDRVKSCSQDQLSNGQNDLSGIPHVDFVWEEAGRLTLILNLENLLSSL